MNQIRLSNIIKKLTENGLSQMVITDPASIFYLTGRLFNPGERLLALYLNANGENRLIINELFTLPEDLGVRKVWFNDTQDGVAVLTGCLIKDKPLGIDKNMAAKFLLKLMEQGAASTYVNASPCVDLVRAKKDGQEAELMRRASFLNDKAMEEVRQNIKEGITEEELAEEVLNSYKRLGADGASFEPLIGFGKNAAIGHHTPDSTPLRGGDCVLIDIGCKKDGYCADMTRTFFYKTVTDKMRQVYEIVKEANAAARAMIVPGVRFCEIDAAARDVIIKAGYGDYFTHRLGHSIGIEVHEYGDVSSVNTAKAECGMTFSVEPGIYIPNEGGVRIEDLILVTETGCETLNHVSRELTVS